MQSPSTLSSPSLKKKKKHPEKNSYIFCKKSQPKQISYTFLKKFLILYGSTQGRYNKNVLDSDSFYFLHSREKNFYAHPLEDFYIVHDHIDASFLFLLQKDFYIGQEHLAIFVFFFSRKIFKSFTCFFSKLFFAFLIIFICNFYYRKKNCKKMFLLCFYMSKNQV